MQNVKDYWTNRQSRAKIAQEHTRKMQSLFPKEIKHSIDNTTVYDELHEFSLPSSCFTTEISVIDADSVSAIFSETVDTHMAVLNFASYKEAGGKFIEGSSAQEESLCHESFLYNVLSHFQFYYSTNCKAKNKALYKNRALYSKDVFFIKEGETKKCDVITCAAPNLTAAREYCNVSDKANTKELTSRCDYVLDVLAEQKAETIILGAYGCGVFGQNPDEVANIFNHLLSNKYKGVFKKVLFAIPNGANGNLTAFKKIFA